MHRLQFREIKQPKGMWETHTSGSTGTAVTVQKYMAQHTTALHCDALFRCWHKWDNNAKTLRITPRVSGTVIRGNLTSSDKYIEGDFKQLTGLPSLFPEDTSQFEAIVAYGETWQGVGIDCYSSEEFGVIAVQCPHDSTHLHVMDHLYIRFDRNLGMVITDTTHPFLKDYEIGDVAYPVVCNCGINLAAITHVQGRVRNQIKLPNGTCPWPKLGLLQNHKVKRIQVVQTSLTDLTVYYTGVFSKATEETMLNSLGYNFNVTAIEGGFSRGKHEEFVCLC